MNETPANEFETKLARLEEIVRKLESAEVGLDESVMLFREGKTISAECEGLIKNAEIIVSQLATPQGEPSR